MSKKGFDFGVNYIIEEKIIKIFGKEEFNPEHILECGQIFAFEKRGENYVVFSKDKMAEIVELDDGYEVRTNDTTYFEHFFDLKTDYSKIMYTLKKYDILKEPIEFGYGIRILKQDLFEVLISFIISANNNISRIKLILNRLKKKFGKKIDDKHFAFPTRQELLIASEVDFAELGAGYRAKYLYKVLRQIGESELDEWNNLPTDKLRKRLIELAGVGPKVADCVLLFGFSRGDVFPVDTWIEKMYKRYYTDEDLSREKIRYNLTDIFGQFSGYAQQYLFYFMRAGKYK